MIDQEIRINAMIAEFNQQISFLSGRCAQLQAELASRDTKIKELTPKEETSVEG